MKKIIVIMSVVLVIFLVAGCDLFVKQQVEYVEVVDIDGAPADNLILAALFALNVELKNAFDVDILSSNKVKVPTEKQEKTKVELEASITLLKTAGALLVEKIEYIESTKTLLITASSQNVS